MDYKKITYLVFLIKFFLIITLNNAISQNSLIQESQNFQYGNFLQNNVDKFEYEENDLNCHKYHSSNNIEIQKNQTPLYIESYYSERANSDLKLQGYDLVKSFGIYNDSSFPASGVQDSYIIGVGDEIIFVLQGAETKVINKRVNREGLIILDFTKPISANGRTFLEIKNEIKARVKSSLVRTSVYVSLGSLKQVSLSIAGEVNCPGQYYVMGNSSLIDVLSLTGGIKKGGSLRNIQLLTNGKVTNIDLYPYIFGGNVNDLSFYNFNLSNGSIIVVPNINNTIALTGDFLKPGIYEILQNKTKLDDILKSHGSFNSPGKTNINVNTLDDQANEKSILSIDKNYSVKNGDVIFGSVKTDYLKNVKVFGPVNDPFLRVKRDNKNSISEYIKTNPLLNNVFRSTLIIKNLEETTQGSSYTIEDLWNVIKGNKDIFVDSNKELIFLSSSDVDFLLNKEIMRIIKGEVIERFSCDAIAIFYQRFQNQSREKRRKYKNLLHSNLNNDDLNLYSNKNRNPNFQNNSLLDKNQIQNQNLVNKSEDKVLCPQIFKSQPKLLSFLIDNIIIIQGDIAAPGIYLKSNNIKLKSILDFAGYDGGEIISFSDTNRIEIKKDRIFLDLDSNQETNYLLKDKPLLSKVLKMDSLLNSSIYPLYGLIKREDTKMGISINITFNPNEVITNKTDYKLHKGDTIKLYTFNFVKEVIKNNFIEKGIPKTKNNEKDFNYGNSIFVRQEEMLSNDNLVTRTDTHQEYVLKEPNLVLDNTYINDNITADNSSLGLIGPSEVELSTNKIIESKTEKPFNEKNQNTEIAILLDSLVEVSGAVIVPGLYPLGSESHFTNLIQVAQGIASDGNIKNTEVTNIKNITTKSNYVFKGGNVFVPSNYSVKDKVKLSGSFESPRDLSHKGNEKLSNIIYSVNLLTKNAYLNFAIIKRQKFDDKSLIYIPFSPIKVFEGKQDFNLQKSDEIYIFSNSEINELINNQSKLNFTITPEILIDNNTFNPNYAGSIEELLKRYIVTIDGEVATPKKLLLAGIYNLEDVISLAGGFTNLADKSLIELLFPYIKDNDEIGIKTSNINFKNKENLSVIIQPGSTLRVPRIQSEFGLGEVLIEGEIKQPGKYRILKNETIFDLLVRVGGLQENAYLDGFVLSRIEEKEREEESIKRLLRELDKAIAVAVETQREVNPVNASDIQMLRNLAIRTTDYKPIGRLVGDFSNVEVLKSTFLDSGDKIFIPKRPTSVTVVGEVMTPGSTLWGQTLSVDDYIKNSAGFTKLADGKNIFVINPNGIARKHQSFWANANTVKPGSIIVVPRRIELASTLGKISAITSVIYQLTLTIAGIDNILND